MNKEQKQRAVEVERMLKEDFGITEDIEAIAYEEGTQEWLDFRINGLGASEVGGVMGLSPYKSSIEIYNEKIGEKTYRKEENEVMFWGKQHEPKITHVWEHYDGTKDGYIQNIKDGKKMRKATKLNCIIRNRKCPWLFANLDGLIHPGGFNLMTGEQMEEAGVLEDKTISGFEAKKWDNEVPPPYLAQVTQAMIILGLRYAEIAMLKDGRFFDVIPMEYPEKFAERIIETTGRFWNDQVIPGREALKKRQELEKKGDYAEAENHQRTIHDLEPEPDGSDAYKNFMAESALAEYMEVEGDMEQFEDAVNNKKWNEAKKICDEFKTYYENCCRKHLKEADAEKMVFGDDGYIQSKSQNNSDKLVFRNQIKEKPDVERIREQLESIDL